MSRKRKICRKNFNNSKTNLIVWITVEMSMVSYMDSRRMNRISVARLETNNTVKWMQRAQDCQAVRFSHSSMAALIIMVGWGRSRTQLLDLKAYLINNNQTKWAMLPKWRHRSHLRPWARHLTWKIVTAKVISMQTTVSTSSRLRELTDLEEDWVQHPSTAR